MLPCFLCNACFGQVKSKYLPSAFPIMAEHIRLFSIYDPEFEPFIATRSVLDFRIGILTIREKWTYTGHFTVEETNIPEGSYAAANLPAAAWLRNPVQDKFEDAYRLESSADLVRHNGAAIREDFKLITHGRQSAPIPPGVQVTGAHQVFIEPGAIINPCFINAETGPVYIGRNAEILEGVCIRGPVAICEGAVIKMGTRIYGATTIGPFCLAGGEIKNSIMTTYSNKAHDGYLGDAVLGEWCNLGAGTSNSNIKNTAGNVTVTFGGVTRDAGLKCGLFMGDYSRSAINTGFNTGTVVGVSANVFGAGLTPKIIPHFSWGFGETRYRFDKALTDINNWMRLKAKSLSPEQEERLRNLFAQSTF
jgi:UDP-N-acetylglucosamine diphosphorylase / glucose-1-phosphate thymidylyltransferase / UDP-N-acetylgalactosamine diphosphorylase / glucosamine-1-phosphate N-acetyltransferase / galactosamine-1-phosphate N-acetyltransferase